MSLYMKSSFIARNFQITNNSYIKYQGLKHESIRTSATWKGETGIF